MTFIYKVKLTGNETLQSIEGQEVVGLVKTTNRTTTIMLHLVPKPYTFTL